MNYIKKYTPKMMVLLFNSLIFLYTTPGMSYEFKAKNIYSPVGNVNLNLEQLPEILKEIETSFGHRYYSENGGGEWEEYIESKITLELEQDDSGFVQPTIIFKSQNGDLEKLLSSRIKSVKVNDYVNSEGNKQKGILLYYLSPNKEYKLNYDILREYIIPINNDPNAIALYLKKIVEQYTLLKEYVNPKEKNPSKNKLDLTKSEIKEDKKVEEKKCVIDKKPIEAKKSVNVKAKKTTLSLQEQTLICMGLKLEEKEIISVGSIYFKECDYEPSSSEIDKIVNHLHEIEVEREWFKSGEGAVLICGHATEPSARKCPACVRDYGNGELSFNRAYYTADQLSKTWYTKDRVVIAYPMGITMNKQSADIYLVRDADVEQNKKDIHLLDKKKCEKKKKKR